MNEIKAILDKIADVLSTVSGIKTIVLGGSRARGTHSPSSDIQKWRSVALLKKHILNGRSILIM